MLGSPIGEVSGASYQPARTREGRRPRSRVLFATSSKLRAEEKEGTGYLLCITECQTFLPQTDKKHAHRKPPDETTYYRTLGSLLENVVNAKFIQYGHLFSRCDIDGKVQRVPERSAQTDYVSVVSSKEENRNSRRKKERNG